MEKTVMKVLKKVLEALHSQSLNELEYQVYASVLLVSDSTNVVNAENRCTAP